MSMVLAAALAAASAMSTAPVPSCSWEHPGADPFAGDVVAAVDRYSDIAADLRAALKVRMAQRRYDDIVRITHNRIEGRHLYGELRDMQLGNGRFCAQVSRAGWSLSAVVHGEVYCEGGHCLVVPTIGRNLSRLVRAAQTPAATGQGTGGDAVFGTPTDLPFPAPADVADELSFDPPSAGLEGPVAGPYDDLNEATPGTGLALQPSGHAMGFAASFAAAAAGDGTDRALAGSTGASALPAVPTLAPPVPEPSTWALLLAGLALVAGACRRRAVA